MAVGARQEKPDDVRQQRSERRPGDGHRAIDPAAAGQHARRQQERRRRQRRAQLLDKDNPEQGQGPVTGQKFESLIHGELLSNECANIIIAVPVLAHALNRSGVARGSVCAPRMAVMLCVRPAAAAVETRS